MTMFPYGATVFAASSSTSPHSRKRISRLVAPRRLDAEDGLVDEVAALLRVREHLLEQAQRQLGLARCALRERGDVVLDGGRADLVERRSLRKTSRCCITSRVRSSVEARTRSA